MSIAIGGGGGGGGDGTPCYPSTKIKTYYLVDGVKHSAEEYAQKLICERLIRIEQKLDELLSR